MKEKRSKTILTLLFSLSLLASIAGATFAYLTVTISGNETATSVVIKSSSLNITYNSGAAIIAVAPAIEPGWTQSKIFTVTNTGDDAAPYSIVWANVFNDFSVTSELTYTVAGVVSAGTGSAGNLGTTTAPTTNGNMITGLVLNENSTHTYTLTVTFNNPSSPSNSNQGKMFAGRIEIR